MSDKYAIVFLCMLKDHYIIGACITAYIHRKFILELNIPIDLIIMCDEYIYGKYADLLKLFFDKVKRIKLTYYNLADRYEFPKEKYISWVSYSTNKWKCLKLIKWNRG